MKYTSDVNYKFRPDGSVMEFRGATIISFLSETHPIFTEIVRMAEEGKQTSYAPKFAFLPSSSYHMTNKVLYNNHKNDRQGSGWSSKYPRDISCSKMDAALAADLARIAKRGDWPESLRMRLWYIDNNSLKLQPATTKCAEKLRLFRDAVAQETGIRWPDHERYIFHITYAYRLQELNEKETLEFEKLRADQTIRFRRQFQEQLPEFDLPAGVFCNFCDMTLFTPYPLKMEE